MSVGSEPSFARRVAAVLVVEAVPGAAVSGDDTATSAAADALAVLRSAGADAEALDTSRLAAVFDRPAAAIDAATRLHRHVGRLMPDPDGATWRAGLHVESLVLTRGGVATRTALARAAVLATVARPGTTAVAAGAVPALGRLRNAAIESAGSGEDVGEAVCLVVPYPPSPRPGRRLVLLLAGGALLAGSGVFAWLARSGWPGAGRRRHLTIGVGVFRSAGTPPPPDWLGQALRDGINTRMSQLPRIHIYSQEFLDFVMRRDGIDAVEAASRLGIEKMLTGSVLVSGEMVRVEVQIVDAASGLIDGAHVATAGLDELLVIEINLVLGVVPQLGLDLSTEERRRIAETRASDLDTLRRLLESEGTTSSGPPPGNLPGADRQSHP